MSITASSVTLAVAGMGIVFGVLALIAAATALASRLDQGRLRREDALAGRSASEPEIGESPSAEAMPVDTTTLLLITAAVATVTTGRHRIRHVRRLVSPTMPRSPWSAQGRHVLMGSHARGRRPR